MNRSVLIKICVVAVTVVALALIDTGSGPRRSSEQQKFDSWLSKIEATVNAGLDDARVVPELRMAAQTVSGEPKIDWQLTVPPFGNPNLSIAVERITRLLGLIREANVLGSDQVTNCKTSCIRITAGDSQQSFTVDLSDKQVASRPQLALMLKLFGTFYAAEQRSREGGNREGGNREGDKREGEGRITPLNERTK